MSNKPSKGLNAGPEPVKLVSLAACAQREVWEGQP